MAKEGATIKKIARSAGYSRGLVRKVLRGERSDVFRVRSSSLEAYLPWLDEQWAGGRRNGSELWRSLRQRGFRGCLRVVSEWSATTAIGKDGCKCDKPRTLRANHCPVDDERPRPTLQGGDRNRGRDRERSRRRLTKIGLAVTAQDIARRLPIDYVGSDNPVRFIHALSKALISTSRVSRAFSRRRRGGLAMRRVTCSGCTFTAT